MRRAGPVARRRLHETFAALCRVPSPSGAERACAELVRHELAAIGLSVDEVDPPPGAATGNLLARIPPTLEGAPTVLLCTHLDTVPPLPPIQPVLRDGGWVNDGRGILGADNKAAVAVALELARHLSEQGGSTPHAGLELLFTVSEETGLQGAGAFNVRRLESSFGYVLDHASPIGEIITASPTYHRIRAEFAGRAAHAGIRPEEGRNAIVAAAHAIAAMELGRLDEQTTANVGLIGGGTAANVVAERCTLEAEVRSLDPERAEAVVTQLVDHLGDAAGAAACDVDVTVEVMFRGYRASRREAAVELAERALREVGYEPRHVRSGGGSDANALRLAGLPCVNLANGTERAHEPGERVSAQALEDMLEVVMVLFELAGQPSAERVPSDTVRN